MPSFMDYLAWAAGGPLEARPTRGNSITDLQLPVVEPPTSSLDRTNTVAARPHQVARDSPRSPVPSPRTPPKEAVYFHEGEGYLLVKDLASGADGNASLVRSRHSGKLYVRKEEMWTTECPNEISFRFTPPPEITNARAMQQIEGVYRSRGWTRWVFRDTKVYYDITYWRYYNLGSLSSFTESITRGGRTIPEFWSAEWLMQMLSTLKRIHKAHLAHKDCHAGNWLLDTQGIRTPTIVLADMGRSKRRTRHIRDGDWVRHCNEDFICALGAICDPVGCAYREETGEIYHIADKPVISEYFLGVLNELARVLTHGYQHLTDLHDQVAWIVLKIQQHRQTFGRAVAPFIIDPPTHPECMTGSTNIRNEVESKAAEFKQWRRAYITGNQIKTRHQSGLGRQANHPGDWYHAATIGPSRWKVDGLD